MKENRIKRVGRGRAILVLAALIVLVGLTVGTCCAYSRLKETCGEQNVITDVTEQVTVSSGSMVKGASVLDAFGLRNGVNIETIDFEGRRQDIMSRIPNIRQIVVTKRMPNRVDITVVERTPVVRLGISGKAADTGRVADTEGVVFVCRRGTAVLPLLRESPVDATAVGRRLEGRKMAGLRLLEAVADPELASLGILEVDASKPDYLLATLGDYSRAKIAWDGMENPTEANHGEMMSRLTNLRNTIRTKVGDGTHLWNATEPGIVYAADTRENLQ